MSTGFSWTAFDSVINKMTCPFRRRLLQGSLMSYSVPWLKKNESRRADKDSYTVRIEKLEQTAFMEKGRNNSEVRHKT